jgi:hypothetical protein
MIQRDDGYVNATEMCNQGGKVLAKYFQGSGSASYIAKVSEKLGLSRDELIQSTMGRYGQTWVHPVVGLHLARWIGVDNAVDANIFLWEKLQSANISLAATRETAKQIEAEKNRVESEKQKVEKEKRQAEAKYIALDRGLEFMRQFVDVCLDADPDRRNTDFCFIDEAYGVYKHFCKSNRKTPIEPFDFRRQLTQILGAGYDVTPGKNPRLDHVSIKHKYKEIGQQAASRDWTSYVA